MGELSKIRLIILKRFITIMPVGLVQFLHLSNALLTVLSKAIK